MVAMGLLCLLLVATGCAGGSETTSSEAGSPPDQDPGPLPTGLSEAYDLAIAASGPKEFVLVDGGGSDGEGTSVYRLGPAGSTVSARFPVPYRTPKVWTDAAGDVVVVGMECAENDDIGPSCGASEIVVSVLEDDGTDQSWHPGITTDAAVGFAAGPWGDAGLVVVTLDPETREARVATVAGPGADAVDRGVVDLRLPAATRICPLDGRTYLFPADLSGGSSDGPALLEVTDQGVEPAGELAAVMGEVSAVSDCSADGRVLVSVLVDGEIESSILSLDDPGNRTELNLEPPYDSAILSLSAGGDLVAWAMTAGREDPAGEDQWQLDRHGDGSWETLGTVSSPEPPMKLAVSSESAAAIVQTDTGRTVRLLGR